MSVSYIPDPVKFRLWGKAAGRCQYRGCNTALYSDALTKAEFNSAYIAHIVADKPDGPRGDAELSPKLGAEESNLMLMCDVHHRLIDKADVDGHPVNLLHEMKAEQEARVALQTGVQPENQSHILLFGAKVGQHDSPLNFARTSIALQPDWYPASSRPIELGFKNSSFEDCEPSFWDVEVENLKRQFDRHVRTGLENGDIGHMSVFGFAPIPLLIALGRELSDIPAAEVYQLHREPASWAWQESPNGFDFSVNEPAETKDIVALTLSLSADIERTRVEEVLGQDISVWNVSHPEPGNDFLKGRDQLRQFRKAMRYAFNEIKKRHGEQASLHVFPAIPIAASIEIGRVWMPKADLPFTVYDQNRSTGGFTPALTIQQS